MFGVKKFQTPAEFGDFLKAGRTVPASPKWCLPKMVATQKVLGDPNIGNFFWPKTFWTGNHFGRNSSSAPANNSIDKNFGGIFVRSKFVSTEIWSENIFSRLFFVGRKILGRKCFERAFFQPKFFFAKSFLANKRKLPKHFFCPNFFSGKTKFGR